MAEYDFSQLSDYEFERVVRDLLQAQWNVTLESFKSGKDQGIDLRYICGPERTIIQCKHYVRSGFRGLLRSLSAELPKVQALMPQHYVVATSVELSPDNKDKIVDALQPFCTSPANVLGRNDLNSMISRFPEVERRHLKLWLTSDSLLERVLHAAVFNESSAEIEHIKKRISLYVENPSFYRAIKILEEKSFCIISGVPGIGKTTLAEMILLHYLSEDFEVYRVWDDIGEIRHVYDGRRNQVFYYDDFLGRTGLKHQLQKNEDERIMRFISECQRGKTRFIMTTREYILNQARSRYEALDQKKLDLASCTINLADYTTLIRAKILYNHLFFSDLPHAYLSAIVKDRAYMSILNHRNFNPRIIERMTDFLNLEELRPSQFVPAFVANLENPRRIWETAYHGHLSMSAKNLLLTLTTFPDHVRVGDLETAFKAFHMDRSSKYNQPISTSDFEKAIRELDGNFILTEPSKSFLMLQFHNPSIRDFLESYLSDNRSDVEDLLHSAVSAEQAEQLHEILTRRQRQPDYAFTLAVLETIERVFDAPSVRLARYMDHQGVLYWDRQYGDSVLLRFIRAMDIAHGLRDSIIIEIVNKLCAKVIARVVTGNVSWSDLSSVLRAVLAGRVPGQNSNGEFFRRLFSVFSDDLDGFSLDVEDFKRVSNFCSSYEALFPPPLVQRIRQEFSKFVEYEVSAIEDDSDPESMEARIEELGGLAGEFGMDLSDIVLSVKEEAEVKRSESFDEEDDDHYPRSTPSLASAPESEIHLMFESLPHSDRSK